MDALVSVLIYESMEARSGPLEEQSQRGITAGSDKQSSAKGKQRYPTSGPDQRLPKGQPEPRLSASRGGAPPTSDASQRPHADGPGIGERCLPLSASSDIINSGKKIEGSSSNDSPGSVSMRSTPINRDPSQLSRGVVPVKQMQKRSHQIPLLHTQEGLAGELPVVTMMSRCFIECLTMRCWHRPCCLMSCVLQITPEVDPWTARALRRLTSQRFTSCLAISCYGVDVRACLLAERLSCSARSHFSVAPWADADANANANASLLGHHHALVS